ncbi:MAG: 50S ribosomal protein L6 [Planctomycetes bacterium]|nr:50S ribosomal protein L6 [Planctomycetota bacterium]
MSRIGKQPVAIPSGVEARLAGNEIFVKGPKGELKQALVPGITVEIQAETKEIVVTRNNETSYHRSLHGLYQRLITNMVKGVTEGYQKTLKVQGTGYRAELKGKDLVLQVGFANAVTVTCPQGIEIEVPKAVSREEMDVIVKGIDKQLVGETAARIRSVRKCDPYKAKGVRYADEHVRRLEGKTFGTA